MSNDSLLGKGETGINTIVCWPPGPVSVVFLLPFKDSCVHSVGRPGEPVLPFVIQHSIATTLCHNDTHTHTHIESEAHNSSSFLSQSHFFFLCASCNSLSFNFTVVKHKSEIRLKIARPNTDELIRLCTPMVFLCTSVIDPPVPSSSFPPTRRWPRMDHYRFWHFSGVQSVRPPPPGVRELRQLLLWPHSSSHCVHL